MVLINQEEVNDLQQNRKERKNIALNDKAVQTHADNSKLEFEKQDSDLSLPEPPSEFVDKYFKSLTSGKKKKRKKIKKKKIENSSQSFSAKWVSLN